MALTSKRSTLIADLTKILSQAKYRSMLTKQNIDDADRSEYRQRREQIKNPSAMIKTHVARTPAALAEEAVNAALGAENAPKLLDPIGVNEITASHSTVYLYRLFDGISAKTALTLGRWWIRRRLLKRICSSSAKCGHAGGICECLGL